MCHQFQLAGDPPPRVRRDACCNGSTVTAVRTYSVRLRRASHNSEAGRVTVRFEGAPVFLLIKLLLLPMWLPFKILLEIAEHSGRRRHHRSRRRSGAACRSVTSTRPRTTPRQPRPDTRAHWRSPVGGPQGSDNRVPVVINIPADSGCCCGRDWLCWPVWRTISVRPGNSSSAHVRSCFGPHTQSRPNAPPPQTSPSQPPACNRPACTCPNPRGLLPNRGDRQLLRARRVLLGCRRWDERSGRRRRTNHLRGQQRSAMGPA